MFVRLFASTLCRRFGKSVGAQLSDTQLGVGISGGCEIVARTTQLLHTMIDSPEDPLSEDTIGTGYGLLFLDLDNAFNRCGRYSNVWRGLEQFCPQLLPMYRCFYGRSQPLIGLDETHTYTQLHEVTTGVIQGDPLAMLYFCCGFQGLLQEMESLLKTSSMTHQSFQNVRETDGSPPPSTSSHTHHTDPPPHILIKAIADDVTIYAPVNLIQRHAEDIKTLVEQHGHKWSCSKSSFFCSPANPYCPDEVHRVKDGLIHLGIPIGNLEYRLVALKQTFTKDIPVLQTIHRHCTRHTAHTLMQLCIMQRPWYAFRGTDFVGSEQHRTINGRTAGQTVEDMATTFDSCITAHFATALAIAPEWLSDHRKVASDWRMPGEYGGLNAPAVASLTGQYQKVLSQNFFWAHMYRHTNTNQLRHESTPEAKIRDLAHTWVSPDWLSQSEQQEEDFRRTNNLPGQTRNARQQPQTQYYSERSRLKVRQLLQWRNRHDQLLQAGVDDVSDGIVAWFLSQSTRNIDRWVHWQGTVDQRFSLNDNEWRAGMRMILGVNSFIALGTPSHCRCGRNLMRSPLHSLTCRRDAGLHAATTCYVIN